MAHVERDSSTPPIMRPFRILLQGFHVLCLQRPWKLPCGFLEGSSNVCRRVLVVEEGERIEALRL